MAQIEFQISDDGATKAFRVDTGAVPEPPQEPEVAATTESRRSRRQGTAPAALEVGRA